MGRTTILKFTTLICACAAVDSTALAQCALNEIAVISAPQASEAALFGTSVAVDGDTAVIGAPGESLAGAAYVYQYAGGAWVFDARITVTDLGAGERFGGYVAVSGPRIMVATSWPNVAGPDPWSVFIFRSQSGAWIQEARFDYSLTNRPTPSLQLIDIDGDRAAVAGINGGDPAPAAYVYRLDGSTWQLESTASCDVGGFAEPSFRYVDLDEDRLLIGHIDSAFASCFEPAPGEGGYQSAVFVRDQGQWVREATLSEQHGKPALGGSLRGDVAVAVGEVTTGPDYWGGMVFKRSGSDWPFEQILTPPDLVPPQGGGSAFVGNRILVTSVLAPPMQRTGKATLFYEQQGVWTGVADYTASDGLVDDRLGDARALSANDRQVLIGLRTRDHGGFPNAGVVYVFDAADCNGNGLPDSCPEECIDDPLCADCNANGVADGCDLDCDGNAVPDDCECGVAAAVLAGPGGLDKNRYISFVPPSACGRSAIRVSLRSLHHPSPGNLACCPPPDFSSFEAGPGCIEGPTGCVRWVGPPGMYLKSASTGTTFFAALLQCAPYYHDWTGIDVLHITGAEIIPNSMYEVQTVDEGCNLGEEASFSTVLTMTTSRWGNVATSFQDPSAPFPPNQPDVLDIGTIVDKLKETLTAASRPRMQLQPAAIVLTNAINIVEVGRTVDAVKGAAYPYGGLTPCAP